MSPEGRLVENLAMDREINGESNVWSTAAQR